jgi:thiamine monophosphate synthase
MKKLLSILFIIPVFVIGHIDNKNVANVIKTISMLTFVGYQVISAS